MLEEISKNLFVYYSPNQGSNVYFLIGKEIALIDSSLRINARDIENALASIGLSTSEVTHVLLTHAHADHIGCASLFKNATIYMHEKDARYVELRDIMYTCSEFFSQNEFPKIHVKLSGNETINVKPFKLQVIFTPGHTAGSVCFFDAQRGLLFSGDTLFAESAGRTDLLGGSEEKLIESLLSLKFLNFNTLLPGHGLVFRGDQQANIDSVLKSISGKLD